MSEMTLADKLKPYVPEIIAAHNAGDNGATQIITLYEMHRSAPSDHVAPVLCEAAFEYWLNSRKAPLS